jgi:CBS domain containing-hemolysin-like protein
MNSYLADTVNLIITAILILLNGFFVAAEFALVKVNASKIKSMQKNGNPFAGIAQWLYKRLNMALSACQMGITMASLALGWIGEPALAHLISPVLMAMGITSQAVVHGVAFGIAFALITSIHIVIGEQFPKIYAIRKPVAVVGWTALPLKMFYILFYPFMWLLDRITSKMLAMVGIKTSGEHESVLTEDEIRASLSIAHHQGDLSHYEHQLLDAAFKFDDQIARQIMLPRQEIDFFNMNDAYEENFAVALKKKHSRFPLCAGSLDDIIGVIHIKDLLGLEISETEELKNISREPVFIPENYPIQLLLQDFKKKKQHIAFIEDEYGNMIGMVTLENVIEQLVGSVEDEFDAEIEEIVKEADNKYTVSGDLSITEINDRLNLNLESEISDTISGLIIEKSGKFINQGFKIEIAPGVVAEVIALKGRRITKLSLHFSNNANSSGSDPS